MVVECELVGFRLGVGPGLISWEAVQLVGGLLLIDSGLTWTSCSCYFKVVGSTWVMAHVVAATAVMVVPSFSFGEGLGPNSKGYFARFVKLNVLPWHLNEYLLKAHCLQHGLRLVLGHVSKS